MVISNCGCFIKGMYKGASPDSILTSFTDQDGCVIYMESKTIVHLYELLKFDAERRNYWKYISKEDEDV